MTLRSRAFLIFCGIVVFLAAAPTILFLAQGYGFDWKTGRVTKTGTLVVKTEPRAASVYLNGVEIKNAPLVKRFLPAGEYQIEIKKAGYHSWKKQIRIHEQQVTFLAAPSDEINLLSTAMPTLVADSVLDFYAAENSNFYLKPDGVYRLTPGDATTSLVASTTFPLVGGQIVEALERDGTAQFIITDQRSAWYLSSDKFFILPKLSHYTFGVLPKTILGIDAKNRLWEIAADGQEKLLHTGVKSAKVLGNAIYLVTAESAPQLRQLDPAGREILIFKDLPPALNMDLIISPERQIFVILDNSIYVLAEQLQKINDRVSYAVWDRGAGNLVYGNAHESWLYDPLGREQNRLITRSSEALGNVFYHRLLGYVFLAEDKTIKAIEADFSGQPNVYILTETKNPNAKINVDESGGFLTYLDGQKLMLRPLR